MIILSCSKKLKNTHYTNQPVECLIVLDDDGLGLVIMQKYGTPIATFDIDRCPVCGGKAINHAPI